jgi:hypothetical protein
MSTAINSPKQWNELSLTAQIPKDQFYHEHDCLDAHCYGPSAYSTTVGTDWTLQIQHKPVHLVQPFNKYTQKTRLSANTLPRGARRHRPINTKHYTEKRELSLFRNLSLPWTQHFPVSADLHLPSAVTSASVLPATTAAVAEPRLA